MTLRPFAVPARWLAWLPWAMLLIPFCLPALAADLPEVVATVHDQPISAEALRDSMRGQLLQLDMERYEAMKAQLDALVAERLIALEAAARGCEHRGIRACRNLRQMEPVTPEQVRSFYDANKERLPRSFEELEGRITVHLQRQSEVRRREALGRELRQQYPVRIALRRPALTSTPMTTHFWVRRTHPSPSSNSPIFNVPTAAAYSPC